MNSFKEKMMVQTLKQISNGWDHEKDCPCYETPDERQQLSKTGCDLYGTVGCRVCYAMFALDVYDKQSDVSAEDDKKFYARCVRENVIPSSAIKLANDITNEAIVKHKKQLPEDKGCLDKIANKIAHSLIKDDALLELVLGILKQEITFEGLLSNCQWC